MPIILRIRKILNLEKKTIEVNNDLLNSFGLGITETIFRKIESEPSLDCLMHDNNNSDIHDFIPVNNTFGVVHNIHDLHF